MRGVLCLLFLAQSNSFDAAFRAGLVALQQNDLAQARLQLESAAGMEPGRAQVWLALAQTYWRSREFKPAKSAAGKAAQLAPEDPVILRGLSLFYLQAREPKSAIEFAERLLAHENRADIRNLLGKAYEMAGRHTEAVREMREGIKLNPYEESFYFDLARDLLEHNQPQDAIGVLEDGKRIFAKSAQLELTLGVAYYAMRRFGNAIDAFLRTIQIDPQLEQPYVFLGRMLEQTEGKLPEVTAAFAALAKADPRNHLANFLYGKTLSFTGQRDQAEDLLRKSIAENGNFWESHFELASVLEGKRDLAAAAQEFMWAADLNPKSPAVHYRLARILDRLGRTGQAKAEHALHEKLTQEESLSIRRQAGGILNLTLPVP